ncbi:MAG: ATP-binding protein [Candidatus Binatia bacterium]|nr:ATP-binding protein [Candidatus Binatia bacterium]
MIAFRGAVFWTCFANGLHRSVVMNLVAELSTAKNDRAWQLAVLSSVRGAAASANLEQLERALRLLAGSPAADSEAFAADVSRKLRRAVSLLHFRSSATALLGAAWPQVHTALRDLLWASECLLEEPGAARWLREWEREWEAHLPEELAKLFGADEATFQTWLEAAPQSQAGAVGELNTPPPSSAAALEEDELLQAFLEEMDEGLRNAEELLLRLERSPQDSDLLHALFRQYHTLKGAAGAVDLQEAADQLHQGEALLQALRDGELELPTPAVVDFFLRLGDSIRAMIDEACGRTPTTTKINDLDDAIAALLQGEPVPETGSARDDDEEPCAETQLPLGNEPTPSAASPQPSSPNLLALREKAAKGQLDPELVAMIEALQQKAEFFASMAATLQAEVEELRTVPVDDLFRRLQRPLRDAARHERKQVRLETAGAELRLPKDLAETLAEVLLHLVRNAVAHGIETPEVRRGRGKRPEGCVRVIVEKQRSCWRVAVSDDGQGLDYAAIRAKAVALGWLKAEAPCDEQRLQEFLFRPGFSTRNDADALAGRGVGMDVVATAVHKLNGSIQVHSTPGGGTTIELSVPVGLEGVRS